MNIETFLFIGKISTASALAATLVGLARLRSLSPEMKLLLILTGVSFTCDAVALNHTALGIGTNYISDVYRLSEFILLIILYGKAFNTSRLRRPLIILSVFYILFFTS